MPDMPFNPYAGPEVYCPATVKEPLPPCRSGLLLLVTLVQVTIEALLFVAVCFMSLSLTLGIFAAAINDRNRFMSITELAVVAGVCLFLSAYLFLLLRAECRNYRPRKHRERNIQLATVSLTLLPIAAGSVTLFHDYRRQTWQNAGSAAMWFAVAVFWMFLVGFRWYAHTRAAAITTQGRNNKTFYDVE